MGLITHARNNFETPVLLELAHRMMQIAPAGIDRVGFCPNGSLAGEMAIKLALHNSDHPGPFLTFADGYHGRTLATMAASWPHPNPDFVRMFPPFVRVQNPRPYRPSLGRERGGGRGALRADAPPDDPARDAGQASGADDGAGARQRRSAGLPARVLPARARDLRRGGRAAHRRRGADGGRRGGTMWACDYYGLRPDIVVWGKGFGGGFPLAGVLLREGLGGFSPGDDAVTFGHFPISLAAGLATVDVLLDEDLAESSRRLGAHATARLRELQDGPPADRRHPLPGPQHRDRAGPRPRDQGACPAGGRSRSTAAPRSSA